jgi:hypothetical protein
MTGRVRKCCPDLQASQQVSQQVSPGSLPSLQLMLPAASQPTSSPSHRQRSTALLSPWTGGGHSTLQTPAFFLNRYGDSRKLWHMSLLEERSGLYCLSLRENRNSVDVSYHCRPVKCSLQPEMLPKAFLCWLIISPSIYVVIIG